MKVCLVYDPVVYLSGASLAALPSGTPNNAERHKTECTAKRQMYALQILCSLVAVRSSESSHQKEFIS